MLHYKGYTGSVDYSEEDKIFFGRVAGIRDIISYEGETSAELEQDFRDGIDDYLKNCEICGQQPNKPFADEIKIKTTPEFHEKVYLKALKNGKSVDDFVQGAIEKVL